MHTFCCYNHMYIKTIQDCFQLSFLISGTIFWSIKIKSVLIELPVVLSQHIPSPTLPNPTLNCNTTLCHLIHNSTPFTTVT